MVYVNDFGVIGGDKRQIAMIQSIASDGYNVHVAGFDHTEFRSGVVKTNVKEVVLNSECIILPLPTTKDQVTLNAPFSDTRILLDDNFAEMMQKKKVFCGMSEKLIETSPIWREITLLDYFKREEFAVRNAVPTAEGAIEIAMREYAGTINGSYCLVSGFGRIGKVLSQMLKGMGAHVTVSARKQKDLAWIDSHGYRSILTSKICDTHGYDIIFNTIPSLVFDAHTLAKSSEDALIIDLASSPGGVDFDAASRLGIKSIQALSLPGKVAPKAAGEIIKKTIYNMIEEDIE